MSVPGAARRLWRDRPRLGALALLGVTALAASAMQSTSAVVLQQTLDENWRGTYDILVTQRGKDPVTAGLLSSDSLVDATTGRLSLADLELIRGLPGVEVAAPVTLVSFADADLLGAPVVWLPVLVREDASLESPEAFRISVASTTDDGTGERALSSRQVIAFAYQPSYSQVVFDSSGAPLVDAEGRTVYATTDLADSPRLLSGDSRVSFTSGNWDEESGAIPLGLTLAPRPGATIVLVDPEAERALLGDAGAFLDPLLETSSARAPLVVLDRAPPALQVTVTVERFDEVTPGAAGAEAVEQAQGVGFLQNGQIAPRIAPDAPTTVVSTYAFDASGSLSPYSDEAVLLGALDPRLVTETLALSPARAGASPRSVLGPRYAVPDDAARALDPAPVTLSPRGYASYGRFVEAPISAGAPTGAVTEYSKLYGSVGSGRASTLPLSARAEVVGTFDVDEVRELVGEARFMPLGGYDVPPPILADGTVLATSLSGFGVPGTNELAIGGFDILEAWNVERPISAIRIRVVGASEYTPQAQARLLSAASALERLGFEATVVAGSSPQPLEVQVAGYALADRNPDGSQQIGDLGVVTQRWSRLGAVTEVNSAVSATSVALLAVSVLSVGVLLAVVQFASVPARRAQAGVLRQLGWRRRRITGWYVAEEGIGLLAIATVGLAAVLVATVQLIAAVSVGLTLALVLGTSLAAVVMGARAPRHTVWRQRARAHSKPPTIAGPERLGLRRARTHLAGSVSLGLAALVVVVGVALAATVFVQGRDLAGPSALGALASARAWVPQGILAAVTLGSGLTLAVLSRRMTLARRIEQDAALTAMGWTSRDIRRSHLGELAVTVAPGALAGVVIVTVMAIVVAAG